MTLTTEIQINYKLSARVGIFLDIRRSTAYYEYRS